MTNNLLTINQFIELARKQGASFGGGDPKIHLAYLTKLGILPQSVKRKVDGEISGCYPESCIFTILKVEQMKEKGMAYSQIAKAINSNTLSTFQSDTLPGSEFHYIESNNQAATPNKLNFTSNPSFLYLIIGLLFGFLLSTLNSQGLAQIRNQAGLPSVPQLNESVSVKSTPQPVESVYVLSIPKQNLDNLDKTNINYLIKN